MTPQQAKREWEKKYNVSVRIDSQHVKVLFRDNLLENLTFEYVPPHCGHKTAWFDGQGNRLHKSPGWIVRKTALRAQRYREWLDTPATGEQEQERGEE